MANKTKTLFDACPTPTSATASSTLGGASPSDAYNRLIGAMETTAGWISNLSPAYPVTLRFDFGAAKTFDSCMIFNPYSSVYERCIKDGGVEYSTDDVAWSSAHEFLDLFAGVPTTARVATLTFVAAQSARYWRIRIDTNYTGNAVSTREWMLWNSADVGARLDTGITLTTPLYTVSDAGKLSDRTYNDADYGLFISQANGVSTTEIDFGASKYIGGLSVYSFYLANYLPTLIYLYTSTDGSAWTYVETVTPPADVAGKLQSIPFSRIYSTRYLKLIMRNGSIGTIFHEWWVYATLTPAVPPDPTSVTARASATGTDIELTWSEIAGDDNLLADIVYDITRQKDGGGYSSIATGVVALTYVDTSLAAGSYDYKVQARNLYHARTSTAVQTSASVTSPAAAGGGAARSMMCGAGMRVS